MSRRLRAHQNGWAGELDYYCISVNSTDKISRNFEVEARFVVETDYSDWKTGNQRVIRSWPPVRNLEFRDTQ